MKKLVLKGCLVAMLVCALILPFAVVQTSKVSAATLNSSPVGQSEVRFPNSKSDECEHVHDKGKCEKHKHEHEKHKHEKKEKKKKKHDNDNG